MLEQLAVYQDTEPHSAALNMAIDEALLDTATLPILRAYRWQHPALSFGYFGSFASVAHYQAEREIVRRWTGGGIVLHGEDLTYSAIIPKGHPLLRSSSIQIYSLLHGAIQRALVDSGIEAVLANSATPKVSEDCFANPVRADVLVSGRKIAGGAQRRTRSGLLHQGSIQLPCLPARVVEDLAAIFCQRFERRTLAPELIARANAIVQAKYGRETWLMRR